MMMLEKPAQATFPLKLGLKDVELALQAGNDTVVPLAALLKEQHLAAIAHGYGDKDWASLGNYIGERAGLENEPVLNRLVVIPDNTIYCRGQPGGWLLISCAAV